MARLIGSRIALRLLALVLVSAYLAVPAAAFHVGHMHPSKVRLIAKIDPGKFRASDVVALGGRVVYRAALAPIAVIEVPSFLAGAVQHVKGVIHVSYDAPVHAYGDNIPWGVYYVKAPRAWNITTGMVDVDGDGSRDVEVAVLDTGVDRDHPDLKDNIAWCVSVLDGMLSPDCHDADGHGTHVAGIVAALANGYGVVGAAPGVEIYAIKVLGDDGQGTFSDLIIGIDVAIKGPDGVIDSDGDGVVAGDPDDDAPEVISMSLGGPDAPPELHDVVKAAHNYGVVIVAAAGNEGADSPVYPAAYPEVIAVGAIDEYENVPDWSNRNPEVAAPGVYINSTVPGGGYDTLSGTSMATPHVSATVALMQAARLANGLPVLPPGSPDDDGNDTVRGILHSTAKDLGEPGYDSLYGYGAIQADRAVRAALGGEQPPETPPPSPPSPSPPQPGPGEPVTVRLVANPGFEEDIEPWSFYGGTYLGSVAWLSGFLGHRGVAEIYGTIPSRAIWVHDSAFLAQTVSVPDKLDSVNITLEYYAYSTKSRASLYIITGFYDLEGGGWLWYTAKRLAPYMQHRWDVLEVSVPDEALKSLEGRDVLYVVGVYSEALTATRGVSIILLLDSADVVATAG